jgi:hypothetical protein
MSMHFHTHTGDDHDWFYVKKNSYLYRRFVEGVPCASSMKKEDQFWMCNTRKCNSFKIVKSAWKGRLRSMSRTAQ